MSDGNISFALFLYENPQEIATLLSQGILGFSAGNNSNVTEMEEIEDVNIFRIDGMSPCALLYIANRGQGNPPPLPPNFRL